VREIKSIRFKRKHISLFSSDKAGHWWIEIGPCDSPLAESYGWWPKHRVSLSQLFTGVDGELNDGLDGQTPARDPHHGEVSDEEFHPMVDDNDTRTDEEVANCLRMFALGYTGNWQWFVGWGQNCHTFQREALRRCKLQVPAYVGKAKF
jgi:hypothetical protein